MKTFLAILASVLPVVALAAVNVNTAQQSELERTKGLDKQKARDIIVWRSANGPIDNFIELQQVPGFTPELVEKLKSQIAFSGDPFTPPPKAVKAATAAKASAKKPSATTLASANPARER